MPIFTTFGFREQKFTSKNLQVGGGGLVVWRLKSLWNSSYEDLKWRFKSVVFWGGWETEKEPEQRSHSRSEFRCKPSPAKNTKFPRVLVFIPQNAYFFGSFSFSPTSHEHEFYGVTGGFTWLIMKTKFVCHNLISPYVKFHNNWTKWT